MIITTREQVMQWWNNLGDNYYQRIILKQRLTDKHFLKRDFETLTGREIEEIWRKEVKTENIYLNRLKEQYKQINEKQSVDSFSFHKIRYDAMRLFCLDTQLVSFNDIEVMEHEVDSSFS